MKKEEMKKVSQGRNGHFLRTAFLCGALLLVPGQTLGGAQIAAAAEASEADEALFAELVEANSYEEIMNRHSSRQEEVTYYYNDQEIHSFLDHVDESKFVEEVSDGNGQVVMDMLYLEAFENENGPGLIEVFLDSEEAYQAQVEDTHRHCSLNIESLEKLVEVTEEDGRYSVTTEVTDDDWVRSRIENLALSWNGALPQRYAYEEGMAFVYTYIFDAETKDLLEVRTTLREADGTEHLYDLGVHAYDLEYDMTASRFAPYFEAEEFSAFTLVFAPGTEEESSMMYAIPKEGVYWTVDYQGEEYLGDVYTDPELTQPYESGTRPDEITLYIPAN